MEDIKKTLGFDFRVSFYIQNAKILLDEAVVNANISKIRNMQLHLPKFDSEVKTVYNIIEELKDYYKLGISFENVDIKTKSLRALCYCIPCTDYSFFEYVLSLIDLHWVSFFLRNIIHCLLRDWKNFDLDIRTKLIEFIIEKAKNVGQERYTSILDYLNENGGYKLGYNISIQEKQLYYCCDVFGLSRDRINYSYFSDVLCGYFEAGTNMQISEIENVLVAHNHAYTDKRIISRMILKAWKNNNLPPKLYGLAMKRIGDPSISSKWSVPATATREEHEIIEKAKRILQIAISSRFVNVFFKTLCKDSARLRFWLEHINHINDFMVFGSISSRNIIQLKIDSDILDRHFFVVNSRNDNCALVLYIGDYAIIEFSEIGALYVYRKNSKFFDQTLGRKVEKLDDLKIAYLNNLVYSDYGQLDMQDQGRMIHSGNWQYRLDRWLHKKIQNNELEYYR